jgi:hypothetical protein
LPSRLGRSEFDVAKIAYGFCPPGVIQIRAAEKAGIVEPLAGDDPAPHIEQRASGASRGRLAEALAAATAQRARRPPAPSRRCCCTRAFMRLEREADALEALRRAAATRAAEPEVLLALGAAARSAGWTRRSCRGNAISSRRVIVPAVARVREMLDCVVRLRAL